MNSTYERCPKCRKAVRVTVLTDGRGGTYDEVDPHECVPEPKRTPPPTRPCPVCGERYGEHGLKTHMARMHGEEVEKPMAEMTKCEWCGKEVRTRGLGPHKARCPKRPEDPEKGKTAPPPAVSTRATDGRSGMPADVFLLPGYLVFCDTEGQPREVRPVGTVHDRR